MNVNDFFDKNEKPLDKLIEGSGFCDILHTIVCVGDSLSSGEFQTLNSDPATKENSPYIYDDRFEYSWGQVMARVTGNKVYNYSRGGMSAKWYCETFADNKGLWNADIVSDAYIFALGVNDCTSILNGGIELGTADDVNTENPSENAKTFAGYYGRIISKYKAISPKAKFFLMTMPSGQKDSKRSELYDRHAELLYKIAEKYDNMYILDFRKYAPDYYEDIFNDSFFLHGHMNAAGYVLTARMVLSYIDYIIRHNMKDFKYIGARKGITHD